MKRRFLIYSIAFILMFFVPILIRNFFIETDVDISVVIFLFLFILINLFTSIYILNLKRWLKLITALFIATVSLFLVYFSTEIDFLFDLYIQTNNILTFAIIGFTAIILHELFFQVCAMKKTVS